MGRGWRSGRDEVFTKAAEEEVGRLVDFVAEAAICIYNLDVEGDVAASCRIVDEGESECIGSTLGYAIGKGRFLVVFSSFYFRWVKISP